jgi:isopenicillin-N epimerase
MPLTRREFVAASLAAAALSALGGDGEEAYWATIRRAFALDPSVIYLNSAGLSPTPSNVLAQVTHEQAFTNSAPVEHLWRVLEPHIEDVRRDLATEFGCDPEELAIVRNASEAMEILIFGLDLKPGDEVIVTTHN